MPDRTTIVMPETLKRRAVERAREQGISFGEFVRRAVEKAAPPRITGGVGVKTGDPYLDNLRIFDDEGPTDWSTRVDEIVYGALDEELRGHKRVSGASPKERPVPRRRRAIRPTS